MKDIFYPLKHEKPLKIKDFNVTLYIITAIGVDEIRSLSAVWNQHEVLNVINPKEKYTLTRDAIRLRRLHTHLQ